MYCDTGRPDRASIHSKLISPGCFMALLSGLSALCQNHAQLISHCERPWASATFTGSRHQFILEFVDGLAVAAGETMIAALPDHEFSIPGQLVADASITGVQHCQDGQLALVVEIEILLLDEV